MIVVVGGHSRNTGKTCALCQIVAATPDAEWTAVKLTPHPHETRAAGGPPDTERYLAAGARRAILLSISPAQMRAAFARIPAGNIIIESTSVLDVLQPDFFVFTVDPTNPDWKASAKRHYQHADAVAEHGCVPAETIERIRERLSEWRS